MAVTLVHWFEDQARASAHRPAMREKRGGRWRETSWAQWRERSRTLASALVHFGVQRGDRVALLSGTRQAFWEADLGVLLAGGATVPIYPSLGGERIAALLRDSGAVVLFAEDALQVERLAEALLRVPAPALRAIVVFDERVYRANEDLDEKRAVDVVDLTISGVEIGTCSAWLDRGREALAETTPELAARLAVSSPDDIATLMYTSGTSGEPKGAILTHRCFTSEIEALTSVVGLGPHDEQLLVLPMAHVFGRLLELAQLRVGYVTSFAESAFKIMDNAAELNPTFLGCVPRFFEKFQAVSFERAAREGRVREKAFHWAFSVGRAVAEKRRRGEALPLSLSLQHRYADKLALQPVRRAFGNRFRFAVSGGAPLARELGEWFDAAGIPVVEGYGLSETTAATHTNLPERPRYGTVGRALPGLAVRLDSDGEILVKGPSVMRGYWNQPEATAEAFDRDGYFRTGDIGTLDKEGYLTITDRKKEIIVTAGGKNIAPRAIESALRLGRFVSQAVVCGDRRPYLVALLTLDEQAAIRWARENDRDTSLGALAVDPELRALVAADIDAANATLASFETVKRFQVLAHDFDVAAGELTPTLKVRRRAVLERHRDIVEALYRDREGERSREGVGSRADAGDRDPRTMR